MRRVAIGADLSTSPKLLSNPVLFVPLPNGRLQGRRGRYRRNWAIRIGKDPGQTQLTMYEKVSRSGMGADLFDPRAESEQFLHFGVDPGRFDPNANARGKDPCNSVETH